MLKIENILDEKDNKSIHFFYKGHFSSVLNDSVIDLTERTKLKKLSTGQRGKIVFLMTECIQNVSKYSDQKEGELDNVYVHINESSFYIFTQNLVKTSKVNDVKNNIEFLNSVNEDLVKDIYINQLVNTQRRTGGAGLGFIQMRRKTKKPILFAFEPYNKNLEFSVFSMSLSFHFNEQIVEDEIVESYYKNILENTNELNTCVYYKGEFSNNFLAPLIHLLDNSYYKSENHLSIDTHAYHCLIELIQNISLHGLQISEDQKPIGLFVLGKNKSIQTVQTLNFITKDDFISVSKNIDVLNEMNKMELMDLYKQKLLDDSSNESGNIGLINIIRYIHPKKIQYSEHLVNSYRILGINIELPS